jgi:hypothetical protein
MSYTNEFWSGKYYNRVIDQSRLKKLSEILQSQKMKGSSDELLNQFEEYFNRKQKVEKKKDPDELVAEMSEAFGMNWRPSFQDVQKRLDEKQIFHPQSNNRFSFPPKRIPRTLRKRR